ncbi:glycoside hydrolase family 26 protein [Streptomyces sp. NPDC003032]
MDSGAWRRRHGKRLSFVGFGVGVVSAVALAAVPGYATGIVRDGEPPGGTPQAPGAPAASPAPAAPAASVVPVPPVAPLASVGPVAPADPAAPVSAPEKAPAFGAYLDYGPRGVRRISELSEWLGGAELRVGHTYLPGDLWSNIEGAPGFLADWAQWRKEKADRLFVLNVPMLERNEEGVDDGDVAGMLRRGAAGDFDRHFRVLAERLVDLGVPDTVVVLGWEMNGTTYTHRCGPDPESWKRYWSRIVTTMRSVAGQKFQFDFTPSRGRDAIPWTRCYPGDDVVDIIGMDSYDQPRGMSFDEQVAEPYGLQKHVGFAAAHKKPISYPEWGLFRNGDNEEYMRGMLKWMDEKKPLYNTVTDYCPHGVWQCKENPESSEVYRDLLSGRGGDTPAVPTEPVKPPRPVDPPDCTPLHLGDWIESWLGEEPCLPFDWWQDE